MEKQITKKIILGIFILTFVIPFSQLTLPSKKTEGATTPSMSELYANPNQNSSQNPYKFTAAQVLKSGVIQQVIGCTGVVNKVAGWMLSVVQSPEKIQERLDKEIKDKKEKLKEMCGIVKSATELASGTVTGPNDLVSGAKTTMENLKIANQKVCMDRIDAMSDDEVKELMEENERAEQQEIKEQCFDGIATTLAKNQLTAMTRGVMNWVNTGYGGNPFYVQNMSALENNIEKEIMENTVGQLANGGAYPYGADFSRSLIRSYKAGYTGYGSGNFLDSLTSDLGAFLSDDEYYSNTGTYGIGGTTDLELAQNANNRFANDFSVGGWNGWLALTQRDQNNPLGFTMLASQYVSNKSNDEITNTKEELSSDNGFLNQKVCIKWDRYDETTRRIKGKFQDGKWVTETSKTKIGEYDKCSSDGWKVVTPGSIIKEKVTNYLNSPERQLELADTINDSLNALFSVLISKLEQNGLAGLSDWAVDVDWTDSTNSIDSGDTDIDSPYSNNGAYDGFNLTKDLGNVYIHDKVYPLGRWNADTNKTVGAVSVSLYPDLAPTTYDENGNAITANLYYTVIKPGKTVLVLNGANNWEVGDRAFWDGTSWQNWKKGQTSPIKNRGVIQIQKDYIAAAKEVRSVLSGVMPKMGELDYCLPGPNPNYEINSADAQSAYQNWVGSIYVGPKDSSGERFGVSIDKPGDMTYDNWASIYDDSPSVWKKIKEYYEYGWLMDMFSNICNDGNNYWYLGVAGMVASSIQGEDCGGDYFFANNGNLSSDNAKELEKKREFAERFQNYTGMSQFQNFFEAFNKMMDKMYFKNITSKYIERENKWLNIETDKNPDYVEMAESGYNLTRNMLYYNEEISKLNEEYINGITQATVNINKLEPIKAEVSGIIKAAQDRRDAKLLEQIKKDKCGTQYHECLAQIEEGTNNNTISFRLIPIASAIDGGNCDDQYTTCMNTPITEADKAAYKAKYKDCLEEENIQFYDPDEITGMGSVDEERCDNDIDDDLDGLVDEKDPDCKNYSSTSGSSVIPCQEVSSYTTRDEGSLVGVGTYSCSHYSTAQTCNEASYAHESYDQGGEKSFEIFQCGWVGGTNTGNTTNINTGTLNKTLNR